VERVWVYVMDNLDSEDCRCLLQVHDALVFEVKEELADLYRVKIQEMMEDVNSICAPGSEEPLFPVKFAVDVTLWE
jgi:DNA polymerase I-like protein with 3'-5' exonuclease and polymerase domains